VNNWYVYIVRCADDTLYTGVTKNVERRVQEHNHSDLLGARYTRGRRPVRLVFHEACLSRSEATKRERELKRLPKHAKKFLIALQRRKGPKLCAR